MQKMLWSTEMDTVLMVAPWELSMHVVVEDVVDLDQEGAVSEDEEGSETEEGLDHPRDVRTTELEWLVWVPYSFRLSRHFN